MSLIGSSVWSLGLHFVVPFREDLEPLCSGSCHWGDSHCHCEGLQPHPPSCLFYFLCVADSWPPSLLLLSPCFPCHYGHPVPWNSEPKQTLLVCHSILSQHQKVIKAACLGFFNTGSPPQTPGACTELQHWFSWVSMVKTLYGFHNYMTQFPSLSLISADTKHFL